MRLNAEQTAAVEATEGYVRLIAGAGTGKTRALTERYVYLAREFGVPSSNMLCLTFTNKAANEMKRRIRASLGSEYDCSFISTLHSFCARVLREDISRLYYPEAFTVLDEGDQKSILAEIYDELGLKLDAVTFRTMLDRIEIEKATLEYMAWMAEPGFDMASLTPASQSQDIIYRYMAKQKKFFALDFADLLNFCVCLFARHPDTAAKWQARLHYIMVDEYQDITPPEANFISTLAAGHKNLFVVGDPDQNIYEWRGATMSVLLGFADAHPPCKTLLLTKNYRSSPEILAAANSLIAHNRVRVEKRLEPTLPSGPKPLWVHAKSEAAEAAATAKELKELAASGESYRGAAVLYRASYLSRAVEAALLEAKIPYKVWGGVGFYQRAEIKDVLAYLRIVAAGDELSLTRVLNVPRRKLGKTKLAALRALAQADGSTLFDALCAHASDAIFKGTGAQSLAETLVSLRAEAAALPVSELTQKLLRQTKYEAYVRQSGDIDRLNNISELLKSIVEAEADYGEPLPLAAFLQNVSLLSDADEPDEPDEVRLMTIHSAKGLEFDTVFVVGMSDGTLPSSRAIAERSASALEEERRLAFVALTRAKKRLFLLEAEGLTPGGAPRTPSRFLTDIAEPLLDRRGIVPREFLTERPAEPAAAAPDTGLSPGARLNHRLLGEGVVVSTDLPAGTCAVRFASGERPMTIEAALRCKTQ